MFPLSRSEQNLSGQGSPYIRYLTDIRVSTDVRSWVSGHTEDMVIRIRLTSKRPPVGTVHLRGHRPLRFVGWLGLIAAISQFLPRTGED